MLNKQQKEAIVQELSNEIAASKTVVICDYKGMTVAQVREVRNALREKSAKMQVVKKTLAKLAFKQAGTDLDVKQLEGQVAVIYGGEDEICAPKVALDFSKKNDKFKILAGTLEKQPLGAAEMINLAKLPTKQEMLGKLVGTINAPISGFVNALAGNLRNFVGVLNAIKDAK